MQNHIACHGSRWDRGNNCPAGRLSQPGIWDGYVDSREVSLL